MPHQAEVLLSISILSLIITFGFLVGIFSREKRQQAANTDEH